MLASSHDRIKITTKFWNNCPGEPPEDQPNRTPITKDVKKRPPQTGSGAQTQTGLVPHPCVTTENREGWIAEVPPEGRGVPACTRITSPSAGSETGRPCNSRPWISVRIPSVQGRRRVAGN